ncbi:AAA domain containing protein, partial [uncultured Caudovirales phage]
LGRPWLGFECKEGKALFINFELTEWMLWDRVAKIAESRGMMQLGERGEWLQFWNLRGRIHDIAQLTAPLIEAIKGGGYSLVVMDPAYKAMGDRDENAAGDINKFQNEMEAVCSQTGVAFALAHHFAKGNSREKAGIDRMSGSGVWARDPDAVLTLTPPEQIKNGKEMVDAEHDMELDMSLRAHPPQEMKRLFWKGYHFEASGKQKFAIKPKEGTKPDTYGPIVRLMPEMLQDAAIEWLGKEANLDAEEARRAWDCVRKPCYDFLTFDIKTKLWRGQGLPF